MKLIVIKKPNEKKEKKLKIKRQTIKMRSLKIIRKQLMGNHKTINQTMNKMIAQMMNLQVLFLILIVK